MRESRESNKIEKEGGGGVGDGDGVVCGDDVVGVGMECWVPGRRWIGGWGWSRGC